MGFLGSFFGGGKSKTKIKKLPAWNPEQQEIFKKLAGLVDVSKPAPPSPDMYVPRTPEEQDYFDYVRSLARNQAMQKLLAGQPAYDVTPEAAERYFEETVRPQYLRELRETILPQIEEAYAGPGYYGSSRARAKTRAVERTVQLLNEAYNQLMYNEELARRQALERALERALPAAQYYGSELGQAGQLARMIEQEKVASDLQKFLMGEKVEGKWSPYYHPAVALALNLLGFSPYVYGSTSVTRGPGLGYSMLSGLARGAGAAIGSRIPLPGIG